MSKDAIHDQVFPVRSRAIRVLRGAGADATAFQALANEAQELGNRFGRAPAAKWWHAFGAALEIVRLLIEWEKASLDAGIDADRFLRAARLRLKQLREAEPDDPFIKQVIDALAAIEADVDLAAIRSLRSKLAAIPLPVAIYTDPLPQVPDWAAEREQSQKEKAPDLTVAFVEFRIDGVAAERIQALRPRENHDLDIAVRASRWPEAATALVLRPLSIEPPTSFDLPTFRFERPSGDSPYFFQQRGRMILHAPQNLRARPFEFIYTAEFEPTSTERPVSIAGQRTLRLDGAAADQQLVTGYPGLDRKLLSLRESLRLEPLVPERDLDDLLTVLIPLANLMGQAAQDNLFPTAISEAEFQNSVREWLRRTPRIGAELEEQPHVAGGRADLSFRGIRIELKSEPAKRLLPDDCRYYAGQPASYAVGTNRRVAILCVLDCSPKTSVAFPVEDGLFVYPLDTGTSPIYIATLFIQGNLPKPSSHSR
jgi:hypothetical protein